LGHLITKDGIKEDPAKVSTIRNFQKPKDGDKKAIESFLGAAGYFQKFIKDFNIIAEPLRKLTYKDSKWYWSDECDKAFAKIKKLLTESGGPVLAFPDMSGKYPFSLHCDASDNGVGAVLYQEQPDGTEKVIQYASRALTPSEKKWHTTEKEALAIIWACEKFSEYLLGQHFEVITDHASLQWLMNYKKGRLARWALRAAEFDFSIKHRKGKDNVVPDHASRYPTGAAPKETGEEDYGRLENSLICEIDDQNVKENTAAIGLAESNHVTLSIPDFINKIIEGYQDEPATSSDARLKASYNRLKSGQPNDQDRHYRLTKHGLLRRDIQVYIPLLKQKMAQTQIVIPRGLRSELLYLFHESCYGP
jgi:hypothetical protein